ncbi:hypothetical protein CLOP_g7449 [Closterium sp. NIES-67]|nr:hypothetical protein CLOP_g7449 [Closterium sp. NIES-67]
MRGGRVAVSAEWQWRQSGSGGRVAEVAASSTAKLPAVGGGGGARQQGRASNRVQQRESMDWVSATHGACMRVGGAKAAEQATGVCRGKVWHAVSGFWPSMLSILSPLHPPTHACSPHHAMPCLLPSCFLAFKPHHLCNQALNPQTSNSW